MFVDPGTQLKLKTRATKTVTQAELDTKTKNWVLSSKGIQINTTVRENDDSDDEWTAVEQIIMNIIKYSHQYIIILLSPQHS